MLMTKAQTQGLAHANIWHRLYIIVVSYISIPIVSILVSQTQF